MEQSNKGQEKQQAWTPGPIQRLARLSIQSSRYANDVEYRDAVDAVLNRPQCDDSAIKDVVQALESTIDQLEYLRGLDSLLTRERQRLITADINRADLALKRLRGES